MTFEPSTLSRRGVLAAAGALAVGGCLDAARTPAPSPTDWPLRGGDPGRTGHAPDADPPRTEPTVAWERTPDPASSRSPIVADGTLYYQTSDSLFVLDPATGEGPEVGTYGNFEGTGSPVFSPSEAYADGMYVVPYGQAVGGYAADPDTWPSELSHDGRDRRRWLSGDGYDNLPPGCCGPRGTSPVPHGGRVLFTDWGVGVLRAVDADTGESVLGRPLAAGFPDVDTDRLFPRSLAVDPEDGAAVVTLQPEFEFRGGVAVFESDGGARWGRQLGPVGGRIAVADGTLYAAAASDGQSRVLAVGLDDGTTLWERPLSGVRGHGVAVDGERVYHYGVTDDDAEAVAVSALDRAEGSVGWSRRVGESVGYDPRGSPLNVTAAGDLLLVPTREGITALEAATGQEQWRFRRTVGTSGGSRVARRPVTPVVPVGDRLVLAATLALYGLEAA